jgi:hypothetical protein
MFEIIMTSFVMLLVEGLPRLLLLEFLVLTLSVLLGREASLRQAKTPSFKLQTSSRFKEKKNLSSEEFTT